MGDTEGVDDGELESKSHLCKDGEAIRDGGVGWRALTMPNL